MRPSSFYRSCLVMPVVVSASLVLAGCGDNSADEAWAAYQRSAAEELGISAPERQQPRNIGAFPDRRQRVIELPEIREGMLNIYALRECQITSLIAARNNQLGRVAPPSQQWIYERTLWQRLDHCWNSDIPERLGDDDAHRLAQLTQLKTEQLPFATWNAIFASEEWEKSFARASHPLHTLPDQDWAEQRAALDYLEQMITQQFNQAWQHDSSTLENHLKTLQQRPLTAEVLRALLLAEQRLNELNAAIAQAEPDAASTCWSEALPGWVDQLEQRAEQWLVAVNSLFDTHAVSPPPAVSDYQQAWLDMQNPEAPWQQFQRALAHHRQWALTLALCTQH
ncbi:DUF3080 family protein [Halomonas sp. 18071143]|uniref:DUF3080 family protein n=1 Tax=Halomonas sp. 18071143 TaxID=2855441 RepID=UPI001C466480|nr:DUF3080 family protein [Halomonas sp. 18071143]